MFLTSPKLPHKQPRWTLPCWKSSSKSKKALRQYKNPPIPTKQEQIVVPDNSALILVKAS